MEAAQSRGDIPSRRGRTAVRPYGTARCAGDLLRVALLPPTARLRVCGAGPYGSFVARPIS